MELACRAMRERGSAAAATSEVVGARRWRGGTVAAKPSLGIGQPALIQLTAMLRHVVWAVPGATSLNTRPMGWPPLSSSFTNRLDEASPGTIHPLAGLASACMNAVTGWRNQSVTAMVTVLDGSDGSGPASSMAKWPA